MPNDDGQVAEIGFDAPVAIVHSGGVTVMSVVMTDRPGELRVRRGATHEEAWAAQDEKVGVPLTARPEEWAVLGLTGLEVRLNSAPAGPPGVPVGPLRIGVRRLV